MSRKSDNNNNNSYTGYCDATKIIKRENISMAQATQGKKRKKKKK
jgi:hypothetical protein